MQVFNIKYNDTVEAAKLPPWFVRLRRQMERRAKRERKHTTFKPNGKREVARRLRQIAAGRLKVTPERNVKMKEAA